MPNNKKKPLALISEKADKNIVNSLSRLGFEVLSLPPDDRLDDPVAHHADMLVFTLDNTVFCNEKYFKNNEAIFKKITDYGYSIFPSVFSVSSVYPHDIALNQAVFRNTVIGRLESCAKSILTHTDRCGYAYRSVNQGYAKCSTLILGDKAVISADDGILSVARELGADALKITNGIGEINLDGYDYGFIGGASAVYENEVFFFGDLSLHTQGDNIASFCESHGFSVISLSSAPLYDYGGAIILPDISSSKQDQAHIEKDHSLM